MMNTGRLVGRINKLFEIIMRFVYLNLLWIFFSIVGLVVLGFVPATVAMFAVVRKWVTGQEDVPIFKTFWRSYRSEFFKSNLLGLFLLIVGLILYIDFRIITVLEGWDSTVMAIILTSLVLLYFMVLLYIFPVFTHYKLKTLQYFKSAFIISLSNPVLTLLMLISGIAIVFISLIISGFPLLLLGSTLSFTMTWLAHFAFRKIEKIKPNVS
jgi:uncharacterized membrane protein YesL